MRVAAAALVLALLPAAGFAADNAPQAGPDKIQLDQLFVQLSKAGSPAAAHPIEQKIAILFQQSGSPSVDLLMTRAGQALAASDKDTALKLLGAVTRLAPTYAEGWHRQGELEEAAGNSSGAMTSLQKTVVLNPRQFRAMDELAVMLEHYGDKAGALKLYREALALDPQLPGVAQRVAELSHQVEGQGI